MPEVLDPVSPLRRSPLSVFPSDLPLLAIDSVSSMDLLFVEGCLDHHPIRILIDGGSRGNFVSSKVAQTLGKQFNPPDHPYITLADGSQHPTTLISPCKITIESYSDTFDLLVAPIMHDIILGKPWLERMNPNINWRNNQLTFTDTHGN